MRHKCHDLKTVAVLVVLLAASHAMTAVEIDDAAPGRKDPCLDPQPRGNAYGLDKKCGPGRGSGGVAKGDFNADGFADLAIGVPFEDIVAATNAGAVQVIYGAANGVRGTDPNVPDDQFWTQDVPGVFDIAETNDNFGAALASGDFDGDGFSDLAIGVPGELVGALQTGIVQILRGSAVGLTAAGNRVIFNAFSGSSAGNSSLTGNRFGNGLVWADFNGDDFGDLVVEVHANNATTFIASAIVFFGSATGLQTLGSEQMNFPTSAIGGETPFFADIVLAAGDFNNDARDDLAVGIPFIDIESAVDTGGVLIFLGSAAGLGLPDQFFSQDTPAVPGVNEAGDAFGDALAVGDFDGDGFRDLAIGAPGEDVVDIVFVNRSNAGAVTVMRGSAAGLTTFGARSFTQDSPGIAGGVESGDGFGDALATGDFNADGSRDLAIGAPGEDLGSVSNAGTVTIIHGSPAGLSVGAGPGSQLWSQDSTGIPSTAEAGDRFGAALTAWDFDADGRTDLAIGVPGEDLVSVTGAVVADAGAVNVIHGSANGLSASNTHLLFQGINGVILGTPDAGDQFGITLY